MESNTQVCDIDCTRAEVQELKDVGVLALQFQLPDKELRHKD